MLDKLFSKFRQQDEDAPEGDPVSHAVAALLVEAARGDEVYTDEEKALIDHMLMTQFSLSQADAATVRTDAEVAQANANDLYGFSRIVKEQLDHEGKCRLIEDMWAIALSDQEKAPYEEMIIRRLVGLIYLEDRESAAARKRAEARLAAQKKN
ncbi:MAG: TerB family tellurite resistance protein [Pseudomonadota bacterium]